MAGGKDSEINALWKVWDDHACIKIPNTQYTLKGFSIAALRSNFYCKELGIMFDAGISGNMSPDYIFVTHSHSDHCANLPFHLYTHKEKVKVYVPEESVDKINNLITSAMALSYDKESEKLDVEPSYELIPAKQTNLTIKNKKINVEILKCDHSVPCVGYGFTEMRNKLKLEYSELSGKELGILRKKGVDINCEVPFHFFCYIGDTSNKILENKNLEKYKNIMIECTFLLDDEIEQATKTKHMHWKSLESYVRSHPDNMFILYHFSQRYKKSEVINFFEKLALPNIIPWVN